VKTLSSILAVVFCAVGAQSADERVKLTGIADLGTNPVALFEIRSARGAVVKPAVYAGETVEGVRVVAIHAKSGKVSLKVDGKDSEAALAAAVETDTPATFQFNDADSRLLLDLYQQISGRTVLPSPSLPGASVSLKSGPALGKEVSLDALADALREKGIIVTPRYDKFAFATPISQVPRLAQIPDPPPAAKPGEGSKEEIPAGLIKFSQADVRPVLDIYQELTGRTLLISPDLPTAKITVKTQTPLTRDEAIWMLDALLYLATIKTVPEWTKFTFVLPATRNVAAPKIPDNPSEALLKKKDPLPPDALKLSEGFPANITLPRLPGGFAPQPQEPPPDPLAVYAKLIDREPLREGHTPRFRVNLRNQTSLHATEAAYALDALAALHGLRFVLVGDKQVKLVRAPDAGKHSAGNN